jgi:cephalosporin-C deacetylase-like acetyl esterase
MSVETVGSPPPEADQVRSVLEQQLPEIISSFNQVLRDQYGMVGISVGGFTVVPESAMTSKVTCDQDGCSVS